MKATPEQEEQLTLIFKAQKIVDNITRGLLTRDEAVWCIVTLVCENDSDN